MHEGLSAFSVVLVLVVAFLLFDLEEVLLAMFIAFLMLAVFAPDELHRIILVITP